MNGVTSITANDGRHADARRESMRLWLDQIVATLPEPRRQMYDLFVARGLDSWSAALELGAGVAEVRRLRRENREAVVRAFEVTALAASEAALGEPWRGAPECAELRQIMAAAQHEDPLAGGRGHFVVLPAALRVSLSRHLSDCIDCQDRRDDCMESWAPELLSIMDDAERCEQTVVDLEPIQEPGNRGSAPGAHRRVSGSGTARNVVIRRAAVTGAGLLVALPLLAFVWPGFAHGQPGSAARSQAFTSGGPSGVAAPPMAGTADGVAGSDHGQPAHRGASGVLSRLSPSPTGSMAGQAYASLPPSVYYTLQPSPSPTPSLGQGTSGSSPAIAPSPSSPRPAKTSPPPAPVTSTTPASRAPSATPTSTPSAATPTPSAAPSTPASATPSSPAPSSPDPTASASDPALSPTAAPSTAVPSASATS